MKVRYKFAEKGGLVILNFPFLAGPDHFDLHSIEIPLTQPPTLMGYCYFYPPCYTTSALPLTEVGQISQ